MKQENRPRAGRTPLYVCSISGGASKTLVFSRSVLLLSQPDWFSAARQVGCSRCTMKKTRPAQSRTRKFSTNTTLGWSLHPRLHSRRRPKEGVCVSCSPSQTSPRRTLTRTAQCSSPRLPPRAFLPLRIQYRSSIAPENITVDGPVSLLHAQNETQPFSRRETEASALTDR